MRIIKPEDYLFPGDEASIEAVHKVPGLSKLLEFVSKNSVEKYYHIICSSSNIKLTSKTAPKIYRFYEEAAEAFGLDEMPDVYLQRGYQYETIVFGVESPTILVNTALLDDLPEELLKVFLAADIAGIKAGHGELNFLRIMCETFGNSLPIPKQLLTIPLMLWSKQKYYTYDRARMLYCNDFELTAKLIGYGEAPPEIMEKVTIDERLEQGREFLDIKGVQAISKTSLTLSESKPWNSLRVIELSNWVESGLYKNALEGQE